jgi:hypothetical protein
MKFSKAAWWPPGLSGFFASVNLKIQSSDYSDNGKFSICKFNDFFKLKTFPSGSHLTGFFI